MKRNREKGNIIVLTALGMTVLVGMAGLAVDVGALRHDKRLQQTAADAAAIAGASNLAPYTGYGKSAGDASTANGFTDTSGSIRTNALPSDCPTDSGSVCVILNTPPKAGLHIGQTGYAEAYVTVNQPTYFMRIFGTSFSKQAVTARAVATNLGGGNSSGCLYTLGAPVKGIGININGNPTVNATSCGIVDNGNLDTKGNALSVNAGTFGVAGTATYKSGTIHCSDASTCPVTGMPASGDPFSYLTPPCNPCTGGTAWNTNGTISPGTYSSISVPNGNGNLIMSPGLYIITGAGGVSLGGNGSITGTGVTIYFAPGAGSMNQTTGNPTIQLSAPTTGTYAGILIYQDPLNTNPSAFGGTTGSFWTGAIYAPKSDLTFFGNTSGTSYGIVVANSLDFSGNPTVNLNGTAGMPPGVNVIKNAVLVE